MPGYIIATLNSIKDPETFAAYQKSASTIFGQYGGRFLLNSQEVEILDGDWNPSGVVLLNSKVMNWLKRSTIRLNTKQLLDRDSILLTVR